MTGPRIGSLCSGYGGLDMAVRDVLGGEIAWFFEYDAAPSKVLAHHWPDVPNYGDMSAADWAGIEQVDVLCGGTPCQDLSGAGKRAGMTDGTRSNLWVQMREGIAIQRPAMVIWENVRGAYSACADSDSGRCQRCVEGTGEHRPVLRALGRVLLDLSSLAYDAEVVPLRASDVGAAHERYRVFVVAFAQDLGHERAGAARKWWARLADSGGAFADSEGFGWGRGLASDFGPAEGAGYARSDSYLDFANAEGFPWSESDGDAGAAGDSDDSRLEGRPTERQRGAERTAGTDALGSSGAVDADPKRVERERRGGQDNLVGAAGTGEADGGEWERHGDADVDSHADASYRLAYLTEDEQRRVDAYIELWEEIEDKHPYFISEDGTDYWPAIQQHERMIGRPVPPPSIPDGKTGNHRYSPFMGEWMMGLDLGHVTNPAIGLSRSEIHKACGNGVVRQQGRVAIAAGCARLFTGPMAVAA